MKKIFLLVLLISITSCQKIIDSVAASGKDEVKVEDLKEIRINNEYALSIPDYMSEMKILHDDASFKYANAFKETYTIVIDENKQEFIDAFKEVEMYDDSKTPLENYSIAQLDSFKETITDLKVKKLTKLRAFESEQYEFHGKVEGLPIAYLIGFVETEDKMYLLMSWTLEARFNKYKDTFKLIHQSLKEI